MKTCTNCLASDPRPKYLGLSRNFAAPLAAYYAQKENDYLLATGGFPQITDSGEGSYRQIQTRGSGECTDQRAHHASLII